MHAVPYILGIDLGSRSLGWVLAAVDGQEQPTHILRAGVRCFEAGVDGDIEVGKDSSRAAVRRQKRLPRRQLWRRARRAAKLFRDLQQHGLLPPGPSQTPPARHELLVALDKSLRPEFAPAGDHLAAQLLPYCLRAAAVSGRLELYAMGRALYHLAQRRGYQTNLRGGNETENADSDPTEDAGKVKTGISELAAAMGSRTLGQYFAGLDPHERRIRQRWTARQMYLDEFDRIWEEQAKHHLILTPKLKQHIWRTIFFQRPLKSQKGLVGTCSLEPDKKRAPLALPAAQEFRVLQTLNHLRIRRPNEPDAPLTPPQRAVVLNRVMSDGDISFADLKKLPEFKGGGRFKFNSELIGHRTNARLAKVFGPRWHEFSAEEQDQICFDVLQYRKRDALMRRGQRAWGLTDEQAELLGDTDLEPGYSNHSAAALAKLLPHLRAGLSYSEARDRAFPESRAAFDPCVFLPPVIEARSDIGNPAVIRALTELRKVVNAIIRQHGKPILVRIELARELKRSRKERKQLTERIRENQRRREEALKQVLLQIPGYYPKRGYDPAIEKVLLWEECEGLCPYTGRPIEMAALIGNQPQFDVERRCGVMRRHPRNRLQQCSLHGSSSRHRKRLSAGRIKGISSA